MKRINLVITLGLMLVIGATSIHAQSGGGYDLTWSSIDGGGGTATGGAYTLDGTIGQADAVGEVANLSYTLSGGFWIAASVDADTFVYLPLVLK